MNLVRFPAIIMCYAVSVALLSARVPAALLATPIASNTGAAPMDTLQPTQPFRLASQARHRARMGAGPCVKRPRWSGSAVQSQRHVA
jgi:hypothetical protein